MAARKPTVRRRIFGSALRRNFPIPVSPKSCTLRRSAHLARIVGKHLQKYLFQAFVAAHRLGIAAGDQPPALDDGDLVAQFFRYVQYVRRKKDGASLVAQFAEDLFQPKGGFRVQPYERLVEEDQLRFVQKGADQRGFLLHAVRIGTDERPEVVGNAKEICIPFDPFRAEIFLHAEHIRDEIEKLDPRKKFVKVGVIGYVGCDLLARYRVAPHRMPVDADLALFEGKDPGHRA